VLFCINYIFCASEVKPSRADVGTFFWLFVCCLSQKAYIIIESTKLMLLSSFVFTVYKFYPTWHIQCTTRHIFLSILFLLAAICHVAFLSTVKQICHSRSRDASKVKMVRYADAYVHKVLMMRKYLAKKKAPLQQNSSWHDVKLRSYLTTMTVMKGI